ncbi:AEC family transporter [Roseomonas sp. OT10]|uniref:AEC family transporter n=1 Tax=Roseomonas cutis TaxID=2897332 RepID=UPI001E42AB5A|nr:AEC family transporter [Roseomonas sp. OT10]UFN47866.1 AEC family transporter [Roseomonas sp. OT10]
MQTWLDAFVPAFGLMLLGAALRRRLLPDPAVWAGIERLVFWVLLPCLLAGSISAVDLSRLPLGGLGAAIWMALALGTLASWLYARGARLGHATGTTVLQGGIRFNNLMAFAIVGPVLGAPGLALGGVTTGLIVPGVQLILTLAFAMGGHGARPSPGRLLRQLATNPLILGCLAGFLLAALGGLPPGLGALTRALGSASVALGMLAVGAALTRAGLRHRPVTQALVTAWKLLAMPALTWSLCALLGLPPLATAVATLFMAMPTATTAYVMARIMGGDAPLMAAMTTNQHVAAVVTLPLWVALLLG